MNIFKAHKQFLVALVLLLQVGRSQAETVTGRVVTPDGRAVAGARVFVSQYLTTRNQAIESTRRTVEVASDAAGRFVAEIRPYENIPLPRGLGQVSLAACKPGLAPGFRFWVPGDNLLRLQTGKTVSGAVYGNNVPDVQSGEVAERMENGFQRVKVQGARVVAISMTTALGNWTLPSALRRYFSAETDAEGRWSIADLPAEQNVTLAVENTPLLFGLKTIKVGQYTGNPFRRSRHSINFDPISVLTGQVMYEDGRPAAGIEVVGYNSYGVPLSQSKTRTDNTGKYSFVVEAGYYEIKIRLKSKQWVLLEPVSASAPDGQAVTMLPLVLTHGGIVEGRMTDAQTGAPVAGAKVAVESTEIIHSGEIIEGRDMAARSDAKGRYRLRLPPGKHRLWLAGHPDYYLSEQAIKAIHDMVAVKKDNITKLDYQLVRGSTLRGTVVDENGQPIKQIHLKPVGLDLKGYNRYHIREIDINDATGAWSIAGLPPSRYRLDVPAEWELRSPAVVEVPAEAPLRLVVRRHQLLGATGRVITPQGQLIEGVQIDVTMRQPDAAEAATRTSRYQNGSIKGKFFRSGMFRIGGLWENDTVVLKPSKPGYRYVSGGEVTYKEGVFTINDIVMEPVS